MNFVCAYGYGALHAYACVPTSVRTKLEVLVGLLSTLCSEAQSLLTSISLAADAHQDHALPPDPVLGFQT